MNYQGVTLLGGKLCVPYVVLQTFPEGLGPEQVEVEYAGDFELKGPLAEYKARIMSQMEKKAKADGRVLFDGPLVRLKDYFPNEDDQKLKLIMQKTSFFAHVASNKSTEKGIKELGGRSAKRVYDLHPKELDNDILANPIGINSAFLTTDGYVVLAERSKKLSQYPALFGVPAGFMTPEKDATPYETVARDGALEEVGRRLIQAKLLELGRALDDLHVEIGMEGRIDGNKEQVENAIRGADWESRKLFTIPFNPKDCAKYLTKTITETPPNVPKSAWIIGKSPKWVPAHHRILYLALARKYGQDEVDKELKKAVS